MIAGGAAALIHFLITSPPSFISLMREREEEIQIEAFHPSDFIRSFPAEDMVPLGALVPPFTSSHRDPGRKLSCHPLSWSGWYPRHSQDSCWRRNQSQIPWNPLCFPALLKAWVTCVTLLAPDTPCMMRRDRSWWE